jgi:hypothetical protein
MMINKTLLSLLLVAVLVTVIVATAVYAESKNEGKDEGKDKKDKGKEGKGDEGKSKSRSKEAKEKHERERKHSRILLTMMLFFNDPDVDGKALIRVTKINNKFLLADNINLVVHNPNPSKAYDNLYACFNNMNLGKMQLVEQSDEGTVVLKLVNRKELPSNATITIPSPVKIVEGEDCVNGTVRYTAS